MTIFRQCFSRFGRSILFGIAVFRAAIAPASSLRSPDFADVPYGFAERQKLDLWQAHRPGLSPLVVFVHGGGWVSGSKAKVPADLLNYLVAAGISVASIDYRFSTGAPLPAPILDAARAVQFLRYHASEWAIDPRRVVGLGNSAGGCSVLWLAFHDDLARPTDSDPVLRESTRLSAVVGFIAQTSIEPSVVSAWIGPKILESPMLLSAVRANGTAALRAPSPAVAALLHEYSPINHLDAGDPPALLIYAAPVHLPAQSPEEAIHEAVFGLKLKEKADAVGAPVALVIDHRPLGDEPARMSLLYQFSRDFIVHQLQTPR